ncbi:hypothetical protein [Roseateles asaccharophilus]|uniref:Uncharacterized protein n=1 Tax=Roseateles asaccharophilus TaxID=582607 RepID=A0ABU2A3H9_9BURK|nr:hypothetical protein [Roseateles asaccharophilus]MDR7331739.1 hypothetical protein [Roseateles asaccharophilus]
MSGLTYVSDDGRGLHISPCADVAYWRHSAWCDAGKWGVTLYPFGVTREVLGAFVVQRPAVVDDFGSLVFVGPVQ